MVKPFLCQGPTNIALRDAKKDSWMSVSMQRRFQQPVFLELPCSYNQSYPRRFCGMAQFRAKRLDLGGFINIKIIRDHTKRKVFEKYEPERYPSLVSPNPCCALQIRCLTLGSERLNLNLQASSTICNPQHIPPAAHASAGATTAVTNALLHKIHADKE